MIGNTKELKSQKIQNQMLKCTSSSLWCVCSTQRIPCGLTKNIAWHKVGMVSTFTQELILALRALDSFLDNEQVV